MLFRIALCFGLVLAFLGPSLAAPTISPVPKPRPVGIASVELAQVSNSNAGFARWVDRFRARARRAGIQNSVFDRSFKGVRYNADVIQKDRNQSEFTKQIWEYLDSAVSDTRVKNGRI